jgi:hypothetical protein
MHLVSNTDKRRHKIERRAQVFEALLNDQSSIIIVIQRG